ncbi:uncharacterized protein TM35_000041100 [Trypanosoma theileri]|uniref:Uncharacterized protein n=1 Tax=Trypanosoma theileri TaxID=67003 RepID=A0A1X0P4P0_9TRYP|nr:uncharacterized protein TM35_000041100 [Trypanosoma theileri]ORC91896.1 hypothetical protein TM35_000041100 [Trypanosoma theileri]
MTTMFVQLRRVVCLLVLLHFCTSVAYASGDAGTEDVARAKAETKIKVAVLDPEKAWETYLDIPNFTEEDLKGDAFLGKEENKELRRTVWNALVTVKNSEIHFKNGTACMTEWKKVVEANEKTVKDAEKATEKIKDLIKRIEEVAEFEPVDGDVNKKKMKLGGKCKDATLKKLLQDIPGVLKDTRGGAPKAEAVFKIAEANQTEILCKATRSNVDDVLRNLEQKIDGITTFVGDYDRSDKAMLVKRAAEGINASLRNVTALIDNVTVQDRFAVGKAVAQVEIWKQAYAELAQLADLGGAEPGSTDGSCNIKEGVTQLEEIRRLINEPKKEMDDAMVKVGADGAEGAQSKDTKEKKKEYARQVMKNVTETIKGVTMGMEREKERVAQEKARREEEARIAAEKEAARRAREEKRRQAAAAAAEAQRVKKEQERKKREEEAERTAEKARLAAAQKAREEEARRVAAEKAKKEAEKAKKKNDGSIPALLHSSLILLVLCLLGCTLVC